jgi:hypothetical protein
MEDDVLHFPEGVLVDDVIGAGRSVNASGDEDVEEKGKVVVLWLTEDEQIAMPQVPIQMEERPKFLPRFRKRRQSHLRI